MATTIPTNCAEFSAETLLAATRGRVLLDAAVAALLGVGIDTRAELSDKVFVALSGARFDAHDFLEQALGQGARALVVRDGAAVQELLGRLRHKEPAERPLVIGVNDPLEALADLARFHRERWSGKLLAIAGSAGKTTTRSACSALLETVAPGCVHSTAGNLNNRIGVPMTLLGLQPEHRYAAIEIGTNCPGEVYALTQIAAPDVAVLTLIDWEHTEGLADLDGVEAEERAIFSSLRSEHVAIGYGEDARVARSVAAARATRRWTYGFSAGADLCVLERSALHPGMVRLVLERRDGTRVAFETALIGRPGALACAAAVLAVESLTGTQLSAQQCATGLGPAGEPGRHTLLELAGPRYVIDDSYNSNPASLENSIQTGEELVAEVGGRLWLVLGEMLELGTHSKAAHQRMGILARQSSAVGVCLIAGDCRWAIEDARRERLDIRFFEDSRGVAEYLAPRLRPRDVVVVKASRGVRAERVVEGLTATWPLVTSKERTGSSPHCGGDQ